MFLGNTAGTIGETSALLLLVGGVYLIAKKIISWRIPVCYIVTLGLFVLLFGGHGFDMTYLAEQLCGGGLMLGAFFMATDYVTSPITPKGQIWYLTWYPDRNLPFIRWFRRGSFLCDYLL